MLRLTMKRTKILFRVNLCVNKPRLDKIEEVVEYGLTQGRQLDVESGLEGNSVWWYMLDRWDYCLAVMEKLNAQKAELTKITGGR